MIKNGIYSKSVCSVQEFAEEFDLCIGNAYKLVDEPGFPLLRIGRRKLVITSGLERWMQERANNQKAC